MENESILQKLLVIQAELKVEKTRWNQFGGFFSRSKEDILEAVKPFAHERGCIVLCDDDVMLVTDGWVYIKTTAKLIDVVTGEVATATSIAREPEKKPKMDSSQTTGSAASYAGKRALGNLFAIDDTADSDTTNTGTDGAQYQQQEQSIIGACTACATKYRFQTEEQMQHSQCQCGNTHFTRV